LTEEITRELARSSILEVIAAGRMASWRGRPIDYEAIGRGLDVRYLAEGKLQRSGETIRLTMQVVDTATSSTVWSGRFSSNVEDVASSLDEFSLAVVVELSEQLLQIETNRAMTKPGPYSGWEHLLRADGFRSRLGSDSARRVLEESRKAVAAAPDLGIAHAHLANAIAAPIIAEGIKPEAALIREMQTHASRAVQLDGNNPRVLTHLVITFGALHDDEAALRAARRAMELNPNNPMAYINLGWAYENLGQIADAIDTYQRQVRLTSHDLMRYQSLANLSRCHLIEGRLVEAEEALDQSLTLHPDYPLAIKWKAIVSAQLDKIGDAHAAIKRLRDVEPGKSIEQHVQQIMFYSRLADRLEEPVATLRRLWAETEPAG